MVEKITPREIEPFCSVVGCESDGKHKIMGEWYCYEHYIRPIPESDSFAEFMAGARELIDSRAREKGYNDEDNDRGNPLFEFTRDHFPGHASGEVVYKLIRFSRKRNKEDLLKAVAWLYLMWRYEK